MRFITYNGNSSLLISLGLHSAAIIAFQLLLMQLLSVVQWHHFAYMIISVAMLGFGASGTLLALWRKPLLARARWLVPLLMIISGLSMMLAFPVIRMSVFSFDAYLLFVDHRQVLILAANYLIFFIPFFLGALSIGIVFISYSNTIGTWYFSNLLGSGVGGLLALWMLASFLPQVTPPLAGMISVAAGLLSMPFSHRRMLLIPAFIAILTAGYLMIFPGPIPVSQYKSLARVMNLPETEIIYRRPGIHGLTEVAQSPYLRYAPAVSLSFTGDIPVKEHVFINAEFAGVISQPPKDKPHILNFTTQQLPYQVEDRSRVLVLNAGSGILLAHALGNHAHRVDAVIENHSLISLMEKDFASASDSLFHRPEVRIYNQEARHFLASLDDEPEYDLIILPMMDAFGGTSGLQALHEDYALTLEAFSLMWQKLNPQGSIAISSWMDYPSRSTLNILASLAATARQHGIPDPGRHMLAVRSWGTITFLLHKIPLSHQQSRDVLKWCQEMFFDPVILPGVPDFEREAYNILEDEAFFSYVDRILAGDDTFFEAYAFAVEPSTDNRPYFSQFLKIRHFNHLASIFGQENVPLLELGYLLLLVTLLQSTFFAVILIILPLLRLRKTPRRKDGTLLYFGTLGLGYMFAEIILIQRFILYFGQPVYAIAAVITTMLISSGAGSLYSERLPRQPSSIFRLAFLVSGFFMVFFFLLTPLLQHTLAFPLSLKILISLMLIGVPAFFMGMLFPLGIRYLSDYDSLQIPWAWGINGCLSVISTSLATLLALEAGFRTVIMVAVISYLVAGLIFLRHRFFFRHIPG